MVQKCSPAIGAALYEHQDWSQECLSTWTARSGLDSNFHWSQGLHLNKWQGEETFGRGLGKVPGPLPRGSNEHV